MAFRSNFWSRLATDPAAKAILSSQWNLRASCLTVDRAFSIGTWTHGGMWQMSEYWPASRNIRVPTPPNIRGGGGVLTGLGSRIAPFLCLDFFLESTFCFCRWSGVNFPAFSLFVTPVF